MKYLGLAYYNPEKFAAMAPDDVQAWVSQCPPMDEKMRATGKVLVSASLAEPKHWITLRPRDGFRPTMLFRPAGTRPEPAVSVPSAKSTWPVATA